MALCLPLLALAQASRPDPADPKVAAPVLRYQSAFADYKPWQDIKPGDWRELNENVAPKANRAAAGHSGHSAAPTAPGGKTSAPAAPGPRQHMHGGQQ